MQKISRQIFNELTWLLLSFGVTLLISFALFGSKLLSNSIDIHLRDTYFVIDPAPIVLSAFFLTTFLVYFMKEFRKSFHRTLPSWMLIVSGLALVLSLTFLIKIFSGIHMNGGWTLYPPLSALGSDKMPVLPQEPTTGYLANLLVWLQVIVLILWVYATFRWGKQRPI